VAQRRLMNGSAAQFVRGRVGPGLPGAPLALVHGMRMLSHGAQILRAVAGVDGLRCCSKFGHGTRTTYEAGV
jgi:hypothetical protein